MIDYLYEKEKSDEKREARMEWFRDKAEEFLCDLCSELDLDGNSTFNREKMKWYVLEALAERSPMPKEYQIWTINDIMEIPMERFNTFLHEFNQVLSLSRTAHAYNKAMGATEPTIQKPFIWIDDGRGEVRTNITWKVREEEKTA